MVPWILQSFAYSQVIWDISSVRTAVPLESNSYSEGLLGKQRSEYSFRCYHFLDTWARCCVIIRTQMWRQRLIKNIESQSEGEDRSTVTMCYAVWRLSERPVKRERMKEFSLGNWDWHSRGPQDSKGSGRYWQKANFSALNSQCFYEIFSTSWQILGPDSSRMGLTTWKVNLKFPGYIQMFTWESLSCGWDKSGASASSIAWWLR